ncbi:MAG TPA: hypothetical protein H9815_07900 [Candidatus Ruania gallistercoris]|uniref:Uncharacterized protein n=1 Tax=Candidatus Ruania gallistercoris TaxID=2838746 RepID=A0A9D2EE91_9MICO|nr:hypothetical protein [Candidatus Ruania gallistercoris]
MTTPDEQHSRQARRWAPSFPARRSSPWRRVRTAAVAALTSLFLAAGAAQALAAPGAGGSAGDEPSTPDSTATAQEWQDWAGELFTEARGTDWAADSAARGCELISVDIVSTTVPEGTLAGAPAGLEVPMVDRAEDCESSPTAHGTAGTTPNSSVVAASACRSITGPSTVCLNRSGSYVVASYTYRGGGSTDGFLRVYERSSSSGCGTGSTLGTRSGTFNSGVTYSRSVYHPGYDHFSASFWHETWYGHTNWGTVCDSL